jgi:hypothetical protein
MKLNYKNAVSIENPKFLIRNPNLLIRDETNQFGAMKDFDSGKIKANFASSFKRTIKPDLKFGMSKDTPFSSPYI